MLHFFGKNKVKTFASSKKSFKTSSVPKLIWERHYVNSKGFRGYKRFPLSTYGDAECENGIRNVKRDDHGEIGQLPVTLKYVFGNGWAAINVYVGENEIGAAYNRVDDVLFQKIIEEKYDAVHVRIEDGNAVIDKDNNGKSKITYRPSTYLFIHLTE